MKDQSKTKQGLIQELVSLRQKIAELEQSKPEWKTEGLKKSEARFRSYFDLPLQGIAITSPKKGWIEVNDRLCSILGYSREEIVLITWAEITHPDDLAADVEQFNRVLSGQIEQYTMDKRFIHKDGKVIWTRVAVGCVRESDGRVDYIVGVMEDITERKQAEEALRESQEQLRDAYRLAHIGIWNWIADTDTVTWTEELYRIAGLDPMLPAPTYAEHSNIYAPQSWDRLKVAVEKALKTGAPYQLELELIRPDGTSRWVNAFGGATYKNHGRVTGLYGTVQDITERQRAEEALRESESQYSNLIDQAWDAVFVIDSTGKMLLVNEQACQMLGYTQEELMRLNITDTYLVEERAIAAQRIATAKQDDHSRYERSMVRKNGTIFPVEVAIGMLPNGMIQGIVRNITERKRAEETLQKSEENFRRSLNDSPLGVRIVTVEGETIYANRAILDIYGYDSLDELKVTPPRKRYTPECYAEFQIRREKRKRGENAPSEYEINIVRKDGEVCHLKVFRKEILWDGEQQFQVIYQDVTERKQAEEELRTSSLQLRALATHLQQIREEERIMIAREIHDEMGGGLTGLKMDLSWLLRKMGDADPGEERVALMDKIHASNALIDQLIRVVRRISTDLRPSILDDLGLIAALEWQLSEFTSRTEIPHEFATTFKYVNMEEDSAVAVFRIFQEALTNVVRHSRATKVVVVLRKGEMGLFGDETLVLEIRDNGRGITEEEIRNPESLGLLGMKERVLTFGGNLSILGEPGGGTALVLKIPRKQGEPS
jgi:PAS domain S-box-containing protein